MDGWLCQQRMGSRRRVHNCHAGCCEAGRSFSRRWRGGRKSRAAPTQNAVPFPLAWEGITVVCSSIHYSASSRCVKFLHGPCAWNLATFEKFRNLCLYKCLTTIWWARTRILVGILSWKCSSSRLVTSARLFSLPWLGWQPTRWEKRERTRVVTNAAMLIVWLIG